MFIKNARWQQKDHLGVHAVLLVASLCLVSPSLSAMDLSVNCDSMMLPNSISFALDSLDVVGPHRILVSGTCIESVHISSRDRVTIEADPMFGASISPPGDADPFAIVIDSSRSIQLIGLVITNVLGTTNANGIWITNNSNVTFDHGTVENQEGDGIRVSENSFVRIADTTIQNNGAVGLVIDSGAFASLGFGGAVNVNNNNTIRGRAGIYVNNGSLRVEGLLSVDSNGRDGLLLQMGSRANIFSNTGSNTISNNLRHGLDVQTGSSINFSGGNTTISNNGRHGVLVLEGGTARFIFGGAVIEGNGGYGVFAALDSGVRFLLGSHQIRANGIPGPGGGVLVTNNSSFLAQTGTDISGNTGIGVTVDNDASTSFQGVTINNNSEEGVLLSHIAVAEFFGDRTTISGNGTADLACDDTSLAFGDLKGAVVNTCKLIEKEKKAK